MSERYWRRFVTGRVLHDMVGEKDKRYMGACGAMGEIAQSIKPARKCRQCEKAIDRSAR